MPSNHERNSLSTHKVNRLPIHKKASCRTYKINRHPTHKITGIRPLKVIVFRLIKDIDKCNTTIVISLYPTKGTGNNRKK